MQMTKSMSKMMVAALLGGALSCLILYGCSSASESSASDVSDAASYGHDTEGLVNDFLEGHENAADIETVAVSHGVQAEMDLSDLVSTSDLVVSAQIEKHFDSIMVEPINSAEPQLFTDVEAHVSEVLYDPDNLADSFITENGILTVRLSGGVGYRVAMINDCEADLVDGETYLLFLYKLDGGSFYNTEGMHMYVQGYAFGAWQLIDGVYESPCAADSLSQDDVASAISDVTDQVNFERATPSMVNKSYVESQMATSISEDGSGLVYSKVMTKEEQTAYEESVLDDFAESQEG